MQIHGEIGPLPPGIAVAAHRRMIHGRDAIVAIISEAFVDRAVDGAQRGAVLQAFLDAVNTAADRPQEDTVTIREPLKLAS